jgi:glycosyltransferase involved in cell wall biosynthesis
MKDSELIFSVIIPVYNGAKYIERALNSVLAQTLQSYEIVIVNDGSSDNSDELIKFYIKQHPEVKIKYIAQENRGLGGGRNTAIKNSSGEFMALLDQDDLWYPNKLEKVHRIFSMHSEVDLVCNNEAIRRNGKVIGDSSYGPNNRDMFRCLLFKGNCLSPSAVAFRKKVVDDIGYFSEDTKRIHFTEDYDFWLRIAKKNHRFYFFAEVLGEFSIHDSNFSFNDMEKIIKNTINVIDFHYSNYEPKKMMDWFRIRMSKAQWYLRNAYYFLKTKNGRKSIKYLLLGIFANPFAVFSILPEILKKIIRTK